SPAGRRTGVPRRCSTAAPTLAPEGTTPESVGFARGTAPPLPTKVWPQCGRTLAVQKALASGGESALHVLAEAVGRSGGGSSPRRCVRPATDVVPGRRSHGARGTLGPGSSIPDRGRRPGLFQRGQCGTRHARPIGPAGAG